MPIGRVACAVVLCVELYDEADGAAARLRAEEAATATARANAAKPKPAKLNPSAGPIGEETPAGSTRPAFVLPPLLPLEWKVTYNSFRVADELEIEIPAEVLPVPAVAIRSITVRAVVQQVDADVWGAGLAGNDLARRLFVGTEGEGDFEGICANVSDTGSGLPTRKLKFVDYVGVLAAKTVPVGAKLDREVPVTEAVREFLVGSPAEGLAVVWVDPDNPEPALGKGLPKAKKTGKGKAVASPFAGQKYLDVLVRECGLVGVVPRVIGATIQLGQAGTIYEGRDRGGDAKATLLLGSVVEDFKSSHDLIGGKIQTVALTCYNPDKGQHIVARWPPDPKTLTPTVVKPGQPPRLAPIAANVGLPGASQLDESILMIPGPPCSDPKVAKEMARAIFVERTRQRIKHTISTHAPWADPDAPAAELGKLLTLRAGDNVKFGIVDDPDALIRPELRAMLAGTDAGAASALLRRQGIRPEVASKVADALARAPANSLFRVDTMTVSGGKRPAELEIVLVNFTAIERDLTAKDLGRQVGDFIDAADKLVEAAVSQTVAATQAMFEALFRDVGDGELDAGDKAAAILALQQKHAEAMKGRR